MHVSLVADEGLLHKVTETTGNSHDFKSSSDVIDRRFIVVADRAYGSHKRFDEYLEQRQFFVNRYEITPSFSLLSAENEANPSREHSNVISPASWEKGNGFPSTVFAS